MLSTNVHPVFPASLSVSHPRIHSLRGLPYCRSYPVSSGAHARNIRCVYSVLVTPTLAPQCLHLITKSGYRPIAGAVNCILISVSASMIFHPHFGQRTGRQLIFISCPCSSFFLCIHIRSFLAAELVSEVYMTCHKFVRLHDKSWQSRGESTPPVHQTVCANLKRKQRKINLTVWPYPFPPFFCIASMRCICIWIFQSSAMTKLRNTFLLKESNMAHILSL